MDCAQEGQTAFTATVKGYARISGKNQVTLPVSALREVALRTGDEVIVEPVGDGELRVRRASASGLEGAFGALTGRYPAGYLERLDAEDRER